MRSPTGARRRRTPARLLAALPLLAVALVAVPRGRAAEVLRLEPGATPHPPIPQAADIHLEPDEWRRLEAGEVVVQIVQRTPEDRMARAIAYLDSSPVALFDVATDSVIAETRFDEIEDVEVLERFPNDRGKRFRAVIDVAFFIPDFEFVSEALYNDTHTGQTFRQVEGDFDKNEGTHSYLWDPARQRTVGILTFDFALKGILSIVPESLILSLASKNLPAGLKRIDRIAIELRTTEPERAARVEAEWQRLKARIEAGELPGQVWTGRPSPTIGPPAEGS